MASIENNLTVGSGGCVKITIDHLSDTVKQEYPGYLLCVVCCTDNQGGLKDIHYQTCKGVSFVNYKDYEIQ